VDGVTVPFIAAYDLIGAGLFADDFVVAGTSTEQLYGLCETFYKPNMVHNLLPLIPVLLMIFVPFNNAVWRGLLMRLCRKWKSCLKWFHRVCCPQSTETRWQDGVPLCTSCECLSSFHFDFFLLVIYILAFYSEKGKTTVRTLKGRVD
jgi:hypothetical protein